MTILSTLLGIGLIGAALYDMFRTLFRPSGSGILSFRVQRVIWRVFQTLDHPRVSAAARAGPIAFIASIVTWLLLFTFGWAFIYWPHVPGSFNYPIGVDPGQHSDFLTALYLSAVTLATLGYGDITPTLSWMWLIAPLEAFVGFVLFTAAVSWLLSIYPILSHRRNFAHQVHLMREAERSVGVSLTDVRVHAAHHLDQITAGLAKVRGDLVQFPVTYFFVEDEPKSSLADVMPYLIDLADRGNQPACPAEVRFEAARLQRAIDDLSDTVATLFLEIESDSVQQVFDAYASDHGRRR